MNLGEANEEEEEEEGEFRLYRNIMYETQEIRKIDIDTVIGEKKRRKDEINGLSMAVTYRISRSPR